jgi:hypothetical protein
MIFTVVALGGLVSGGGFAGLAQRLVIVHMQRSEQSVVEVLLISRAMQSSTVFLHQSLSPQT